MCYVLWRLLPVILAAPLILAIVALALALAFMEYNGRPFILAIENAFSFLIHPKLYLWNNERKKALVKEQGVSTSDTTVYIPHLSESKLHELSWSLDIKERIAGGTANEEERSRPADDVLAPMHTAKGARI